MSEATRPRDGLLPNISVNDHDGPRIKIPVVRDPNFIRIAPNTFNAWHVPGEGLDSRFSIFFQAVERREVTQYLNLAIPRQGVIDQKDTILEANELAAMTLTLTQMRGLKEAIDGALAIYERHIAGQAKT